MSGWTFTHQAGAQREATWAALDHWDRLARIDLAAMAAEALVVVVAHPDDEALAIGGLLATAGTLGLPTVVVVATDGEGSHPDSPTVTPADLAVVRQAELAAAVARLHPQARLQRLGIPDGHVAEHAASLRRALEPLLRAGVLVVSTWRDDRHPDHEAVALVAADLAAATGARHLEAPIWLWHWGAAEDVPWQHACLLELDPHSQETKAAALACYPSQTGALSDQPGDEAVVDAAFLASFRRPFETFIEHPGDAEPQSEEAQPAEVFEDLHATNLDPWSTETSWYEARKRALALASLRSERLGRVLEVGCSVGVLTVALAARAAEVVALDVSASAIAHARARCRGLPVQVLQARVPAEWPDGRFDLVVLSEVGYFLTAADLDHTLARAAESLSEDGSVLLVHWRHAVHGWPLDGDLVHERARSVLGESDLRVATSVTDDDFRLDLYCRAASPSLAMVEGKKTDEE